MDGIHPDIEDIAKTVTNGPSDARRTHLRHFSRWWSENSDGSPLEATTKDVVNFLQDESGRGLAPHSLVGTKQTLAVMLDAAMDLDEIDRRDNPVKEANISRYVENYGTVTKKKQFAESTEGKVYLERDEIKKLRENVPAPKVRNELLVKLMSQVGARRNEVVSIKLSDIDRDNRSVTLRDNKTSKVRTVPYNDLSPEVDLWLDKYRASYKPAERSEYLFLTEQSEQLSPNRISEIISIAAEEAGIQEIMYEDAGGNPRRKVTPHTLRHTFAVRLLNEGVDVRYVQKLMGHADISQTEVYLKITENDAGDAYREADPTFET